MDSEWSWSLAVLCRSCWEQDAKEHGGWSRTRSASRERERTHALRDAAALIHNRMKSPQADGLRTVPECGSPLPLLLGTGRERTRRLVPHGVRESRAREDSRTPGRCRAHPQPEGKPPSRWTPNGPGVRQSSAALGGNGTRKNTAVGPAWGSRVESARGLAHSRTLPRDPFNVRAAGDRYDR